MDRQTSEMAARIEDLQKAVEGLQAQNRSYMDMLGFVAHELKNPLTSAVMSLYTVKDGYLGPITPAQEKSLESVAISLEYFQDMIRNYLDLSRLEKGELQVTKTYFPLQTRVVQPVLGDLERALARRGMAVVNCIPEGKVVHADANLLRVVYENLVGNAVKYGLDGGAILLEAQEEGDSVILTVQNDSSGIPPEQVSRLFGKFSRLDSAEHAGKRGTGLGLYICKEIVEKHGGTIWVESEMGAWVRFRFTLPLPAERMKVQDA